MKLLIVEDDQSKAEQVASIARDVKPDTQVEIARSLTDAVRILERACFDLIVLDFMLPVHESGPAVDQSRDLIGIVSGSARSRYSCLIALTAYEEIIAEVSTRFAESGVIVCKYSAHDDAWRLTLKSVIERHANRTSRRFVIICALEKERHGFSRTRAVLEPKKSVSGLDVCDVRIGEQLGAVVLCPRMGLVNASVVTALAIDRFMPEVVCMSGICAGFSGESKIGQVLVAHPSFEYQVGKFTPTGFEIEQYHVTMSEDLRQTLNELTSGDGFVDSLYEDIASPEIEKAEPKMCPFVSGSAVVADENVVSAIKSQHRKVAGLDMESFGVLQAASLSDFEVKAFSAKAVVDYADKDKSDGFQSDGCVLSARYCVEAISKLLGVS